MEDISPSVFHSLTTFLGTRYHQCSNCSNALRRSSKTLAACGGNREHRPWPVCLPASSLRSIGQWGTTAGTSYVKNIPIYWDWEQSPFTTVLCPICCRSPGLSWERRKLWEIRKQIVEVLTLDTEPALRYIGLLPSIATITARTLNGDVKLSLRFGRELFGVARFYPSLAWPSFRVPLLQIAAGERIPVCRVCLSPRHSTTECRICHLNDLCFCCRMPQDLGCVGCVRHSDTDRVSCQLRIRSFVFVAPRSLAV